MVCFSVSGLQVMYTINTDNCGETSQGQVPTNMIDLRTYGLDNTQKTAFLFDVKAKQDIAVLATDTYDIHNSENYYRLYIGLGGNMWCHIADVRNGYFTERQNIYASYADELNSKPFWFSWENGEIKAGHGDTIGQQTFLTWSDPSPMYIYGIGIGTCWGHTGEWKIKIDGKLKAKMIKKPQNTDLTNIFSGALFCLIKLSYNVLLLSVSKTKTTIKM